MHEGSPHPARFARDPPPPGEGEPLHIRASVPDSVFVQQTRFIVPMVWSAWVRRLFPSLTGVRERSAERRYGLHLAPCGAAYRVTGTRTPRRSTVAFVVPRDRASGAGPEGCPSRYPGGFRHPSSGPVQPLKAAPVVGRTVTRGVPGRGLRIPGRRRHTLLHQIDASR